MSLITSPARSIRDLEDFLYEQWVERRAKRAQVTLSPGAGTLVLNRLEQEGALLAGTIPDSVPGMRVVQEFNQVGDLARVTLHVIGNLNFSYNADNQYNWVLGLTPEIPASLKAQFGAGRAELDLTGLQISSLETEMGAGESVITLPESGNFTAELSTGVGQVGIIVPKGLAVRIDPDTALVSKSLPASYIRQDDGSIVSPEYGMAQNQVVVRISLAVGNLVVKEVP